MHQFTTRDIHTLLPIYLVMVSVNGSSVDVSNINVSTLLPAVNDQSHPTLIERLNHIRDDTGLEQFGFTFR